MNIKDFSELWKEEDRVFNNQSAEFWDTRADEMTRHICGAFDTRKDELLNFFTARNILNAETKILDIGCGPGRYSSAFAKNAKQVTGIDISAKMIQYAEQNTASELMCHVYYETAAWESVDLDARGWRNEYDLVFASMSPAICGVDTLLKMCEASKGYCFMSGLIEKNDEIGDQLYRAMYGEHPPRRGRHLYYALNILFLSGYYPEIIYHDTNLELVLTVEQAVETYCTELRRLKPVSTDMQKQIADYLGSVANDDGLITGKSRTKLAWIFWKV